MNTSVKTIGDEASNQPQQGLDGLGSARAQTGAGLQQLAYNTSTLIHWGMDALSEGENQLRKKSKYARQATTEQILREPIKFMLIAAAVGAGLMGLLALFRR